MLKYNNEGFTLIELIVVMAIIAILVLLAAPNFLGYTKDANVTAMQQDTKVLTDASELYHINTNEWPISGEAVTDHGIGGVDELYPLDKSNLKSSIGNIKGDYVDYGIAIEGKYAGRVFHLNGVEDKNGVVKHGTVKYENALNEESFNGIYTQEEINNFIAEGYQPIATPQDLQNVELTGKYIQVNNIDMKDVKDFAPIGNNKNPFRGIYDGAGYAISGVTINKPTTNNVGIFGYSISAEFRNIILMNNKITGNESTGTLAGKTHNVSMNNIRLITGEVTGDMWVGGIVGYFGDKSKIFQSSTEKGFTIKGRSRVGGVIGSNYGDSLIEASYSSANVSGVSRIGGIVGHNFNESVLQNSYSNARVSGQSIVGGVSGGNYSGSRVENAYSTAILSYNTIGGGLIGYSEENNSVGNSYYLDTLPQNIHGIALPLRSLKQASTYNNWEEGSWVIQDGKLPVLRWQFD